MIRYTIAFTGRVQGVGFRYTTVNVARQFKVAGWVRNEPDGSVKCVAEGQQDELDRFVAAVQRAMDGYVADTHIENGTATGEFTGFHVQH